MKTRLFSYTIAAALLLALPVVTFAKGGGGKGKHATMAAADSISAIDTTAKTVTVTTSAGSKTYTVNAGTKITVNGAADKKIDDLKSSMEVKVTAGTPDTVAASIDAKDAAAATAGKGGKKGGKKGG